MGTSWARRLGAVRPKVAGQGQRLERSSSKTVGQGLLKGAPELAGPRRLQIQSASYEAPLPGSAAVEHDRPP
jgi:hypothetical protein